MHIFVCVHMQEKLSGGKSVLFFLNHGCCCCSLRLGSF